jgi:hypothetical protein
MSAEHPMVYADRRYLKGRLGEVHGISIGLSQRLYPCDVFGRIEPEP